jgi:AraC-like DNA-binding protein
LLADYLPLVEYDVGHDALFGESATVTALDDIACVDVSWQRRRFERPARGRGVADPVDHVAIAAVHSGGEDLQVEGETRRLRAGDIVLWNCASHTTISVPTTLHKSAAIIPQTVLRYLAPKDAWRSPIVDLSAAPTALLLRAGLRHMASNAPDTPATMRRTRNAVMEVVLGTIESGGDPSAGTARSALRLAVSDWIDRHIFDADVNASTIAAAHAVSVRTLHRAFESDPVSLGGLLRLRRLERARDMLDNTASTVTSIAERLNFANPSHFSRAFTDRYAMTPTEFRARHRLTDQSLADG